MSPKVISGQERAALKDIPECYIREEADDTEVRLEMIVVAEEIAPYKLETQSGCVLIPLHFFLFAQNPVVRDHGSLSTGHSLTLFARLA